MQHWVILMKNKQDSFPYDQKSIEKQIHTKWAGNPVYFAEEVDSTNLLIKRLASEGASEGTLAVAEYQSAGRGRLGRSWQAPPKTCIMMSLLLRPEFSPQLASMLTLVMGLSVAQGIGCLGLDVSIKWPNDVVLSKKKTCGILSEMGMSGDKIDYVVIGTGINVNIDEFPPELAETATSLYLERGQVLDRAKLIGYVMEAFENNYERFASTGDVSLLKDDYHRLLANMNKPVRVLHPTQPFEGVAIGINDLGELLVATQEGRVIPVNSGEVSVRGLYSYV